LCAPGVDGIIPHDPGAFTQGLEIRNGFLWESAGLYGQSTFRKTSMENGEVLETLRLPDSVFAEGFTFLNDSTVVLLTWKEHTAFLIHTGNMEIIEAVPFQGEGWGLCYGEGVLYHSDGTSAITIRDPHTLEPTGSICVTLNGTPQPFLNELEFINGSIAANQWRTSRILFIDPVTGMVERVVNLTNVIPDAPGVMNGIAAADNHRIYCTGKNWPVTIILDEGGGD